MRLLYMVDVNMMTAMNKPFFSTKNCVVSYTTNDPMCASIGAYHLILLNVQDNHWCQWVYQFAHEYCHHLIDGALSGEWSRLLWFEETICELSSLYNLFMMESFCRDNGLASYEASVKSYLDNQLNNKGKPVYRLNASGGWYEVYSEVLSSEGYKKDLYNAIAVLMYPVFVENPCLWKIIMSIGDIRRWNSLEELFNHLQETADETYLESFLKMRKLFG